MNNKIKINMEFNFPRNEKKSSNKIDSEDASDMMIFQLFHCHKCGFHPNVIKEIWVNGDEENIVVQLLSIKPGEVKIIHVDGQIKLNDNQYNEILICGNCGALGRRLVVPEDLLKINNIIIHDNKQNIIDSREIDDNETASLIDEI